MNMAKIGSGGMRIAFLSDVHGNAVALEAVLADIKKKSVDQIIVLGDISYRGPQPKEALQLIQGLNTNVIKGNADEWLVRGVLQGEVPEQALEMMIREREWALQYMEQADLDYLQNLPEEIVLSLSENLRLHAFHATPHSLFEVVLPHQENHVLMDKLMSAQQASIYVYAHIHQPYIRYIQGKCLVNIGSVGLPFDGLPHSSYAIIEARDKRFRVTIERVEYNQARVLQQYKEKNYPNLELMSRVIREAVSPFG